MCGIFGFSLNRELLEKDILLAHKCLKGLEHRGPDGKGLWYDKKRGVLLGHTRLSIIDLSDNNAQPMIRGKYVLVYNGELYNYQELRKELQAKGEIFNTSGDTEVFLKSLVTWGKEAFDKFDGMFAFALYDGKRLQLGTDPFGEKPLYIYISKDGIYFSSELNVFIEHFSIEKEIDQVTQQQFLGLGFLLEPKTGFKNIEKVGPATHILLQGTRITKAKYWKAYQLGIEDSKKDGIKASDIDEIHDKLIESVKRRIVADVPIGIFLSSGIDSTLVAALIKKELKIDMVAYTVKFTSGEVDDESAQANKICKFLDMEHIILDEHRDSTAKTPSDVFSLLGELNDNITVLSSYLMSDAASRHIKVALTGMGGDEMFYGYNKYHILYNWRRLFCLPKPIRACCRTVFKRIFPQRARLARYLTAGKGNAYLCVKNTAAFDFLKGLHELEDSIKKQMNLYGNDSLVVSRMFDLCHSMPNSYIPNMERGAMRASIEIRTPFLNRGLYKKIQQHRGRDYLKRGRKWVTKTILGRYLPQELFELPKRGFTQPRKEFLDSFISERELNNLVIENNLSPEIVKSKEKGWIDIILRLALMKEFAQWNP